MLYFFIIYYGTLIIIAVVVVALVLHDTQYTTTTIICVRSSQTILISPNHYMQLPFLEVDFPALALTARFCRMHKRGIRRPSTAGLSSSNSRGRLFPFLSGDLKLRPSTSPLKRNKFVKSHGKRSLVYDECTIKLAEWSVPVELFDKKTESEKKKRWTKRGISAKGRPRTSPAMLKASSRSPARVVAERPQTAKTRLLKTEKILNKEILALVAQRTTAQDLYPVYKMAPANPLDPYKEAKREEYLTREETLARKRIEFAHRARQEYEKTHNKGEFEMLDVRTHGKIFRPFVAQEQRWLMKWGSSKFEDMRGNCHIFRSLAKWEELKEEARVKYKKNRNEKIKQKRRAKRRKKLKERRKDRGHGLY